MRAHDRHAPRQACIPPARHGRRREVADAVLSGDAQRGRELRRRDRGGAAARAGGSRVHLSGRKGTRGPCGRRALPRDRPRPRLAPVVLPVEQHPGRRADRPGRAGPAVAARRAREAGPAHAGRQADPRRSSPTSPASGSASARSRRPSPSSISFRTSTTTCGTPSSAKPSSSSTPSSTRTRARSIC